MFRIAYIRINICTKKGRTLCKYCKSSSIIPALDAFGCNQYTLLAVSGTDIEQGQLYASPKIKEKLGVPSPLLFV